MQTESLPIVVLGAGPVGLAAAVHLLDRGLEPLVLEAGPGPGSAVRAWGHVRIFSPWRYCLDPAAKRRLEAAGWVAPDAAELPTGAELVAKYLEPLAALPELAPRVRYGTRATAVSRLGRDLLKTPDRERVPFLVRAVDASGTEIELHASAVIDATGTWHSKNPLGASGLPALGEKAASERISYRVPDVLGSERQRFAGKKVVVVGAGHSAIDALVDLAALAREVPATAITWVLRSGVSERLFGGGKTDQLPARGALGSAARELVERGTVDLATGYSIAAIHRTDEGLVLDGPAGPLGPFDEVVAATGFRPDLELLREVRTDLDPALESPRTLAPLIDPNVHSCGTVPPHGERELRQPEPGLYVVGMKSYGRAPTFLLATGYEQVRSVAAALAGDQAAADKVELILPATGVCSGPGKGLPTLQPAAACCG